MPQARNMTAATSNSPWRNRLISWAAITNMVADQALRTMTTTAIPQRTKNRLFRTWLKGNRAFKACQTYHNALYSAAKTAKVTRSTAVKPRARGLAPVTAAMVLSPYAHDD